MEPRESDGEVMRQFEHKSEWSNMPYPPDDSDLGRLGWELVSVVYNPRADLAFTFFYKREVSK